MTAWIAIAALPFAATAAGTDGKLNQVPAQDALAAYYLTNQQTQLSAKGSKGPDDVYTLQFTSVPNAGTTAFRDQPQAHGTVQTLTITKHGAPVASHTSTAYFLVDPYVPLGRVNASGTPYAVIINQYELPVAAAVGSKGPFYNMTWYHDTDMSAVDGFMTASYAIEAAETGAARLCLSIEVSRVTAQGVTDGLAEGTQVNCYSISATGKAALASVDMSVGGQVLAFR